MGFIFDGLDAEAYDRNYNDRQLVERILAYFKPQTSRILAVSLTVVLSSLFSTVVPIVISNSLDRLAVDSSTQTLIILTVLITVLGSLAWVTNFIRRWFSAEAVGNVVLKIREDAFDAVLKRDLSFYDTFASGKIVSRVTSDTQAFSQTV